MVQTEETQGPAAGRPPSMSKPTPRPMRPRPSRRPRIPLSCRSSIPDEPVADNGMVDFAVEVQNPNKTVEAVDPVIEVVGKDDGGNVIFDETIETPGVLPDSTYYYSYVAGFIANRPISKVVKPATVEFAITTPEGSWRATDQTLADVYTVQDKGAADTQFGAKGVHGHSDRVRISMAPRSRASMWCCSIRTAILRAASSRSSTPRARPGGRLRHPRRGRPAVRELRRVRQPWAEDAE